MDRSPSFPFAVDEKALKGEGPGALPRKAFRGAVTNADAYHATRAAVRIEGDALRIGNRFVPLARYREIAFIAAGNAAVSQALAVVQSLGTRLTQGFVASPDAAPPEIPFRSVRVPRGYPGSREGVEAAGLALELARGLGPSDLLIVLVSGGASAALALPDPSTTPADPVAWYSAVRAAGAGSREIALVEAVTFGGGLDGGLAEAAGAAEVQPIVVDRGDGGEVVGGSPTRRLTARERGLAQAAIARAVEHGGLGSASAPWLADLTASTRAPLPSNIGRPVVVASPEDALRGAADAVGEKRYLPRLTERAILGEPQTVAQRFLDRLDEIHRDEAGALRSGDREGLVGFATATFGVPEGLDERPAIRRFLAEARPRLRHRGAIVGAFATSGGTSPTDPAGGFIEAGPIAGQEVLRVLGIPMQSGVTDVGCLLIAVIPNL